MSVVGKIASVTALSAAVLMGGVGVAQAQQPPARPAAEAEIPIPLKVTVTIQRFEGEAKTASLPFTLWVNTGRDAASIRMGSDVPVPTTTLSEGTTTMSYRYQSVGTNIDCTASVVSDGLFRVFLSIDDSQLSQVKGAVPAQVDGARAVLQRFRATHSPILRDGQTVQFSVATDKTTGEVTKLEVTLNVVK
jgi:hypothetical protein